MAPHATPANPLPNSSPSALIIPPSLSPRDCQRAAAQAQGASRERVARREADRMEMQAPLVIRPIDRVAKDWVSNPRKMGAKLMGAPRPWCQPKLSPILPTSSGAPKGERESPLRMGPVAGRMTRHPGNWELNAAGSLKASMNPSQIQLAHSSLRKEGTPSTETLRSTSNH